MAEQISWPSGTYEFTLDVGFCGMSIDLEVVIPYDFGIKLKDWALMTNEEREQIVEDQSKFLMGEYISYGISIQSKFY